MDGLHGSIKRNCQPKRHTQALRTQNHMCYRYSLTMVKYNTESFQAARNYGFFRKYMHTQSCDARS